MATQEELYSALQKADAAGDAAGAKQLAEYIRSSNPMEHTSPQGQSAYGVNTSPLQDQISKNVLGDMSGPQRFIAGMGMNLARMGRYTGNKLGLVTDDEMNSSRDGDTALSNTPGGAGGDLAGGAVWTAPLGMGATGAIGRMGSMGARIAANPISRGMVEGAVQGGMQSPKGKTLEGMGIGGIAGTALPAVVKGGQVLANGTGVTPEARSLMARGVDLTPGQMNPEGAMNQLEGAWKSVPFIGPSIAATRKRAEDQTRAALIGEAAAPGAKITPSNDVNGMLDEAYKSFGPAYDQAKGFPLVLQAGKPVIVNQGSNVPLSSAFQQIVKDKGVLASNDTRRIVGNFLDNQLTKPIKKSDDLLAMRSQLRSTIRGIKGTSQDDLAQKELLSNAESAVTHALESQLPADAMNALKATDAQYGKYKIVENAVAKGGDKEFTPFQASQAVRSATDKGEYARGGGGDLRDITSAAAKTFGNEPPPTGARLAAIGLPLAAMAAKPMIGIPAAAGSSLLTLTKTGRRLAAGDTSVQRGMRSIAPAVANQIPPSGREAIAQLLNRASVQQLDKWIGTRMAASEQE